MSTTAEAKPDSRRLPGIQLQPVRSTSCIFVCIVCLFDLLSFGLQAGYTTPIPGATRESIQLTATHQAPSHWAFEVSFAKMRVLICRGHLRTLCPSFVALRGFADSGSGVGAAAPHRRGGEDLKTRRERLGRGRSRGLGASAVQTPSFPLQWAPLLLGGSRAAV